MSGQALERTPHPVDSLISIHVTVLIVNVFHAVHICTEQDKIKRNAGAKLSPRTQTELEANVQNRLDYLSSAPSVIASFFQAPFTQYAA